MTVLIYSILAVFFLVYLLMFFYFKHDFFNDIYHQLDRYFHDFKHTEAKNCIGAASENNKMKDLNGVIQPNLSPTLGGVTKISPIQKEQTKEDQLNFAKPLIDKKLKLGDKWYLINAEWFIKWANYVDLKIPSIESKMSKLTQKPDKINNKNLLNPSTKKLKANLTEEIDYFTIPEELWLYLSRLYLITQEEDVIERYVINDSSDSDETSLVIEVRPLVVSISCSAKSNQILSCVMSRQIPLDDVISTIRKKFEVPSTLTSAHRLYFKTKDNKQMHLCDLKDKITLTNSGYGSEDIIYLEFQNENDTWPTEQPEKPTKSSLSTKSSIPSAPPLQNAKTVTMLPHTRQASSNFSNRHHDYRPGLCGLSNLGNTCFMNSSIQMMSNVPELTDYFRSDSYKKELNTTNPLGRGGQLAEAYADLINEIWSGSNNYTMPRNFKLQIGRFAPQFTGFQQQDSHELLAFLLDGLHEDLNRIIKKPYVEMGSHLGKTDEQFAQESWDDHLKRNDSIIVDLFHGLLKSTLNCLVCNDISIKFDPFCYLSLPLPSKKERMIEVFFVPLNLEEPITKLKLSVLKNSMVSDLCSALVSHFPHVNKSNLVVCDVYTHKFFKIYEQSEQISLIKDRDDIYIYELSSSYNATDYLKVKVQLKEKSIHQYSSNYFGLPLFLTVPKANLTYGSLYQHVLEPLKRYIDVNSLTSAAATSAANTSSEEIDSKLSDSLNVKDEELDEDMSKDDLSKGQSLVLKKIFTCIPCKNDSIDYDSFQSNENTDETPVDWQNLLINTRETYGSQSSSNQILSIVADFGQNFNKRHFNKKPLEDYEEHPSLNNQLVKKKDIISLRDCFSLYTKTEKLSENDYWYCSKCKEHQPSTKKFDLWSLPKVLVLQLKRFSYSRNYRDKIDSLIDFPLRDLDLKDYLIQSNLDGVCTKYNLIAVSNHYGSLGGGHYTAYGQNRCDSKWYYFDDSSVSSADESSVCTHNAYLLTYIRKDCYPTDNQENSEKMDC